MSLQTPTLQTPLGMVELRGPGPSRKNLELKLTPWNKNSARDYEHPPSAEGRAVVTKNWLKTKATHKGTVALESYRQHVKQCMLVAVFEMQIQDLGNATTQITDPMSRNPRPPGTLKREMEDHKQEMIEGRIQVPIKAMNSEVALDVSDKRDQSHLQVHELKKICKRTGRWTTRYFRIEGSRLYVFKSRHTHTVHKAYSLNNDVSCRYENSRMNNLTVPFPSNWSDRVKLDVPVERVHGPLFLYADNPKQAKQWERAIKMGKHVAEPSSREALSVCVGRVAGNVLLKGWDAIFQYKKELDDTMNLMKQLGMKMMQVELSKGWNKMRLLYQKKNYAQRHRMEIQKFTLKLLQETLTSSSEKPARSPQEVRYGAVSFIQRKFTNLRRELIFEREYPLGNQPVTRMQQAQMTRVCGTSFNSTALKDAFQLAMDKEVTDKLASEPGLLESRKKTFSEINQPVGFSNVNVTENLAMLSFSEADESVDSSQLNASTWANFVNLDEISSVVLHSQRRLDHDHKGKTLLDPKMCHGPWLTINGPRICWARALQMRMDSKHQKYKEVVGVDDGLALGRSLVQGDKVEWLHIRISVSDANIPNVHTTAEDDTLRSTVESERAPEGQQQPQQKKKEERTTYLVLTILGQQFRSVRLPGHSPAYTPLRPDGLQGQRAHNAFEASVPILKREGLASLDETDVIVDIVEFDEEPKLCRTIWAGKMPLWKLFGEKRSIAERIEHTAEKAKEVFGLAGPLEEEVEHSLAQSIGSGMAEAKRKRIQLAHPGAKHGTELLHHAHIDFDASARVAEMKEPARTPVSPELHGRGPPTALWSTHRGLWYDPKLGASKFVADKVASFLEMKIDTLSIPAEFKDDGGVWRYHVEARSAGVSVSTVPLLRPLADWKGIINCDEGTISWFGARLYVPLPPGCWRSEDLTQRPTVEIAVFRSPGQGSERTMRYREFVGEGRGGPSGGPPQQKVYHAVVNLDGLYLDAEVKGRVVPLSLARGDPVRVKLEDGFFDGDPKQSGATPAASLSCDVALRDRDYVRLHRAARSEDTRLGAQMVICVGDKAMIKAEEPISYPKDETEFRRRCFPGKFDAKNMGKQGAVTLRDPFMSHEYTLSGLEKVHDYRFKMKNFVGNAPDDLLPHKYVLLASEQAHIESSKPGVYWRILNDLAKNRKSQGHDAAPAGARGKPPPQVVSTLTHLLKNVPVTVIAVYANNTCDVEVASSFVQEWELKPEREYAIPGVVVVKRFQDPHPHIAARNAPPGTGDVSERPRMRIFLREVPLASLSAVQSTSFNIYDAAMPSVEHVMAAKPSDISNEFNPRQHTPDVRAAVPLGGYSITAGPVPADASVACKYEWSFHLQMPSDEDMYQFVTMLRQCVRQDLFQQVQKMREYKTKQTESTNAARYHFGRAYTTLSGHLEVVLVEARNLRPPKVQQLPISLSAMSADSSKYFDEMNRITHRQYSPFVTFRLQNEVEDMLCRGSLIQQSMSIQNTNGPSWASDSASGGWVFRTPSLEPSGMPNLFFEMEVLSPGGAMMQNVSIGKVRVPVTAKQTVPAGQERMAENEIKEAFIQQQFKEVDDASKALLREDAPPHLDVWRRRSIVYSILMRQIKEKAQIEKFIETMVDDFKTMPSPGVEHRDLCNAKNPFNNLWLPLSHMKDGVLAPRDSGEIRIMTLWVQNQQDNRRLPTTARAFLTHELRPKMSLSVKVRDPVFDIPMRTTGYNPNEVKYPDFPDSHADKQRSHIEQMFSTVPYLVCLNNQSAGRWSAFYAPRIREQDPGEWSSLANLRSAADVVGAFQIDEILRRGVPDTWRMPVWLDITNARQAMEFVEPKQAGFTLDRYQSLVKYGGTLMTEAMVQMREDMVGAASWEDTKNPGPANLHMLKLRRVQNVCTALINFSLDPMADMGKPQPQGYPYFKCTDATEKDARTHFNYTRAPADRGAEPTGIAYCESLLVIVFFLLLVQTDTREEDDGRPRTDSKELATLKDKVYGKARAPPAKRNAQTQDTEAELCAFWLLYTLIGSPANGEFRAYYGIPREAGHSSRTSPLAVAQGPMQDILRLDRAVLAADKELWVHLGAIGFHFSSVFYGAFMRLFAFTLPTASVFRLWDLIFAESVKWRQSGKPARHALVDFGFAVVMECNQALKLCESALEARDCLINYMEHLYDPSKVIELCAKVEESSWTRILHLPHLGHTDNYTTVLGHYMDHYLNTFVQQNSILASLVRDEPNCHLPLNDNRGKNAQWQDPRITTENIKRHIIPIFSNLFEGTKRDTFSGLFRQTPLLIIEDAPPTDNTVMGSVWRLLDTASHLLVSDNREMSAARKQPLPFDHKLIQGEPYPLTAAEFGTQLLRASGMKNGLPPFNKVSQLAEFFQTSDSDPHVSLNEFLMSLICASKGTVGEKAMALFGLFAYAGSIGNMKHIRAVTHQAHVVVERSDGVAELTSAKPPAKSDVERTTALHFIIEGHSGHQWEFLGEVFVSSLAPFVQSTLSGDFPEKFSIWGHATKHLKQNRQLGEQEVNEHRYIGDMNVAIKWMPSEQEPNKGQLGVHVYSIQFQGLENANKRNPRIKMYTYRNAGQGFERQEIPRWDPRGLVRKLGAAVTAGAVFGGAYGAVMEWEETMWLDPLGYPHSHAGAGPGHGWSEREKAWQWNTKQGEQYSERNREFRKEFCQGSKSADLISLPACRIITQHILNRGLAPVTNRQAALISDAVFCRSGAVPGILDALCIEASSLKKAQDSVKSLKQYCDRNKIAYVDMKYELMLAHERGVTRQLGHLNLFPDEAPNTPSAQSFAGTLKVADPFPGKAKQLWIRYCRAGDGERFSKVIRVDGEGNLVGATEPMRVSHAQQASSIELFMDIQPGQQVGHQMEAQYAISKHEFLSCVLASPLLSETLRRLGSTDNKLECVPHGSAISLWVQAADPTSEQQDDDFLDAVGVRQGVLLELYDKDRMIGDKDDFLGECWLPDLGTLLDRPQQFLLQVGKAPKHWLGEGETRPDQRKYTEIAQSDNEDEKCKGTLFVEASWRMPAKQADPAVAEKAAKGDREAQFAEEDRSHTGELYLRIIKAEGLRAADRKLGGSQKTSSDPYVMAYVKNQTEIGSEEGWTKSTVLGRHEPILTTKAKSGTVNPDWSTDKTAQVTIPLKTGAYEKRTKQHHHITDAFASRSQRQHAALAHERRVFGDSDELSVFFNYTPDHAQGPPATHNVQVYLGDTIHHFKTKLCEACKQEALNPRGSEALRPRFEALSKNVTHRHMFTFFTPSTKLRELHQDGRQGTHEYKLLEEKEQNDPANWRPLDDTRTFHDYRTTAGFGAGVVKLKLGEINHGFASRNPHYRAYEEKRTELSKKVEDTNTDQKCFGYVRYEHQNDGPSFEWRPAILEKVDSTSERSRFKADYLYARPLSNSVGAKDDTVLKAMSEEVDQDRVVLGPAHPKIQVANNVEHQDKLQQAPKMFEKGTTEKAIAEELTKSLMADYEKTRRHVENAAKSSGGAGAMPKPKRPDPITEKEVRAFLRHHETSG